MSYGATAWWCIIAINFGRWSFFIINVQPERRNLLGCLGGKCIHFSPQWSGKPNGLGFFSPFYWFKATLVSTTGYSSCCYAFSSLFLSDLHPPTPCLSYPPWYISCSAVAFSRSLAPALSAPCFSGFLLSSSSFPIQLRHKHHFRRLWDSRSPMA